MTRTAPKAFALRAASLALTLALLLGLLVVPVSAAPRPADTTQGYYSVISKTEYAVAPGVKETDLLLNSTKGTEQNKGFMLEIDPKNLNIALKACYKNYDGSAWGMQTPTLQAAAAEKKLKQTDENANVVGVINTSFFNMSTGEPNGLLVMNGKTWHENAGGWGYVAVTADGSVEICDGSMQPPANTVEATSGREILVWDSELRVTPDNDPDRVPRAGIGTKADGTVVLFVADGRQAPVSVGMSVRELAETMLDLGCVKALNLDGGGSATLMTEREGTGVLSIKNTPSDGYERSVSSTLLVVSTAKPSGEFDHASLSPNGEFYTPGTQVAFSALGVDSAGVGVALPEGLAWALAADSADMGAIDAATGLFTAGEKTGPVNVELKQGDKVVGRTVIQVQAPDKITFMNDSINLTYGEVSDLGMTASYQGSTLNVKEGDFVWTIDKTEGNGEAGTFQGNNFVASQNNAARNLSVTATVRATSKWDAAVYSTIEVGIGTQPVVVLDGGEAGGDGHNYNNIAYVHANANGGGLAYETHADDHGDVIVVHYINGDGSSRGGIASAEQIDIDTGKVRFGEKALRLDYDFRKITGIEGACVGFDHDIEIPGSPTGIGFWCYAPENTPNLWLRIRVRDGSGAIKTLNFTTQSQNVGLPGDDTLLKDWNIGTLGGINWVGWKYVECDLKNVPGPITLMGGETIRLMDTNGGQGDMGQWVCQKDDSGKVVYGGIGDKALFVGHQKGYLYIDNLQLVYGTNNADIDNPVIKTIQAGPTLDTAVELADDGSTVINSNEVTFYAEFADVENENTTGLDFGYIYLDGVNMSRNPNFAEQITDGKLVLNAMQLANGSHTVKILVHDKYGNEAVVSRDFTVQGNDETLTAVNLVPLDDTAPLGGAYGIALTTNRLDDVKSVKVEMKVDNATVDTVEFAPDYADSTYTVENGVLTIQAVRKAEATSTGEGRIAAIRLNVPSTLEQGAALIYSVTEGSVEYATEKESNVVNTFALPATRIPVSAFYRVELGVAVEGAETSEVRVLDLNGNPAMNVRIYLAGSPDQFLGTSGPGGKESFTELLKHPTFTVYAKGEDGYSFPVEGKVLPAAGSADGKPYYILENATENAFRTKSISWMANPLAAGEQAVIEYAEKTDYDRTGVFTHSAEGRSILRGFIDAAARLNNVMIQGLEINTEYAYRVGDGKIWSEVRTFKTIDNDVDSTTTLFLVGDTQTAVGETDNITKINQYLQSDPKNHGFGHFSLGIQLGDAVEEPALYYSWQGFLEAVERADGAFAHTDMLHVIGNHEQFADENATAANAIFAMDPEATHYSVTYGNVYVATIDFTQDRAQLEEAAEWLIRDAKASSAPWKILVMHQPPYYTNVEGGSNIVHEILPPAIDEAGISFVFSGHDHAYARTEPMTGGEVDPDGTVYYICGSTGEKAYGVTNTPEFHFATANQDYEGIFLTITATDNSIDVNTYDLTDIWQDNDGTGAKPVLYQTIDTFHRTKYDPCKQGEHTWIYRPGRESLMCETCLARLDKSEYSGRAKLENTDDEVYMIAGVLQTGWFAVGDEMYHAGADHVLHDTVTTDTRTCTKNGHIETVCNTCGQTYRGNETFRSGHTWDANHVCTVCGTVGKDIAKVEFTMGRNFYYKEAGARVQPTPKLTDNGKTLDLKNSTMGDDGYLSWENYDRIGTGTVTVEGRGDYYGVLSIDYRILPNPVANVTITGVTNDTVSLSWDPVAGAEGYVVFAYDRAARTQTELASTDKTSITLEDLTPNTAYTLCIKARTVVDGENYDSYNYQWVYPKTTGDKPDTAALEAAIEAAEAIERENLLPDDQKKLDDAIAAAKAALETAATQKEVDAALTALNEAVAAIAPHDCPAKAFTDMPALDNWAHAPIDWAVVNKITAGTSETTFGPDDTCTRAQVVTFLWRAAGEPEPETTTNPFTDVKQGDYFYKAVLWAVEHKITSGSTETTFAPGETCTRAQVVTFLFRFAASQTAEPTPTVAPTAPTAVLTGALAFTDVPADAYYAEAVAWAVDNKITSGTSETAFSPNDACTRAQVVTFLYRDLAE